MIPLLFLVTCFSLLGLILLADHVKNRFQHTATSRRTLAMEVAVALFLAIFASFAFWPGVSWVGRVLLVMAIGMPVYVFMSFATVEVWRHRKQEGFDREIIRLSREVDRWQQEAERLNWELNDLERRKSSREEEGLRLTARLRALDDQLQAWEQAGVGLKHSRQVEKWSAELSNLDDNALDECRENLLTEAAGLQGEDKAALIARINLLDLIMIRRVYNVPGGPFAELERRIGHLRKKRVRTERRLAQIRDELEHWQEQKTAFIREKISLD